MRIHRILAEAAVDILQSVFKEHRVLDHELAVVFDRNPKWGKRDRSFVAETVFEVVRWKRALAFLADSEETRAICAAQWTRMGLEIPEWWRYKGERAGEIARREGDLASQPRAVRESIPDWLDELGCSELGDAWDVEIAALNQRAPVYLRVNTLRTTREKAVEWLLSAGVEVSEVADVPDALMLPLGRVLPKALRMDGRVEIQDAGSQMIAPLIEVNPGDHVIDACSGAGGKSLHLAAMMKNEGQVLALDVESGKLAELERRAKRAGASCVRSSLISDHTISRLANHADRLLIDAPCSGLGTLKRQPDLKWRLKPAQLERVRGIQKELLARYPSMLKAGGLLVYATCSILPSENRAAVDSLLAAGRFSLLSEHAMTPAVTGFDGFYAAVMRKENGV